MSGECDKCGEHTWECGCELMVYVNQAFTEEVIRRYENQILGIMKLRQEKYSSEKNDNEWLEFSEFVAIRRMSVEHGKV